MKKPTSVFAKTLMMSIIIGSANAANTPPPDAMYTCTHPQYVMLFWKNYDNRLNYKQYRKCPASFSSKKKFTSWGSCEVTNPSTACYTVLNPNDDSVPRPPRSKFERAPRPPASIE